MAEATRPLRLLVRTLGGEELRMDASPDDTVAALARRAAALLGVPGHERRPRLAMGATPLPRTATLAATRLVDDDEVTLIWCQDQESGPAANWRHGGRSSTRPASAEWLAAQLAAAAARASADGSEGQCLELARRQGLDGLLPQLLQGLPPGLVSLDLRDCDLKASHIRQLFAALPPSVECLRVADNELSAEALAELLPSRSVPWAGFRVLDVGGCGFVPPEGAPRRRKPRFNFSLLVPLLGERTQELGLEDMHMDAPELKELLQCCPNLRRLDVSSGPGDLEDAWSALGAHCPLLEELQAWDRRFSPKSVAMIASGCPRLRVLVLGQGVGAEGFAVLREAGLDLDTVAACVTQVDEVAAAAQLDVDWLLLQSHNAPEVIQRFRESPQALEAALQDVAAARVELDMAGLCAGALQALGGRLRAIWHLVDEGALLLPELATAAHSLPHLQKLSLLSQEQVCPAQLATVFAACPLLELVHLNAETNQPEPVDSAILALATHCPRLRKLDLYRRTLQDPAGTLSRACRGWPELRYLCAFNGSDWTASEEHLQLAHALADHCPLLEELVLYSVPREWLPVLARGCPNVHCT